MTLLPKYMIKRLVAENGVTLVGDEIHVNITNIITTIPLDKLPDDLASMAAIKVDGKVIVDPGKPEFLDRVKIIVKGRAYPIASIKTIEGGEIPTGEVITIVIPNVAGIARGEHHAFEAAVVDRPKKKNDPLVIAFERTVY